METKKKMMMMTRKERRKKVRERKNRMDRFIRGKHLIKVRNIELILRKFWCELWFNLFHKKLINVNT